MSTRTYGSKAADEAGERLNQLCAQHSTTIKAFNGHTRFGVSTDDHRVLLEVEDQGEQVFVHWLHDEEAREIAGALNRAVSWLNEEEVASAEFTLALDAADTNTKGGRMRYEMVQCDGVGCLEDNVHIDDRRHLGWIVGPDGEDLCPRCWAACQEALVAELGPDFELGPGPELEIRLRPKEQLGFF